VIRFLMYAVPVVVVLYAFIDALLSPGDDVRTLPKWLWLVVIVLIPLLGAIAWLLAGRPASGLADDGANPGRRRPPVAPDDDPAFLRTIDDATWSQRMRQRRAEKASGPPAMPAAPEPPATQADEPSAGSADAPDPADH
jgi:hypothetical protein